MRVPYTVPAIKPGDGRVCGTFKTMSGLLNGYVRVSPSAKARRSQERLDRYKVMLEMTFIGDAHGGGDYRALRGSALNCVPR